MSFAADLAQLAPSFSGQFLQPSDPAYDSVRRVHNGLVDKRPALIARCAGTAGVADAVKLARSLDLPAAVRGGGRRLRAELCEAPRSENEIRPR
jgi:FAD/FMN-containing dehydrogenase